MNCSGKHAAMLATCVANGWPTDTYLAADHPLQQAIAETFARTTGEPVEHVAVDGCGAPLLSTSLTGLARAFARSAHGPRRDRRSRSRRPIRAHPEYVSGTRRDELTLLRAIPGAIGKAGAESCYAVALPDGRAFAHEDRRRGGPGAAGGDGGVARGARRDGGGRCGRRRGASYGRSGVARRRATSG